MKIKFSLILTLLLININLTMSQNYNFATYNIKFDDKNDLENLWKDRSEHLFNLIKFHQMDIIGTQEGLKNQLEDISKSLNFPYVGTSREEGGQKGEFSAIFYNPTKFNLLENKTFWLSTSPDVPSKGWDAALNRVCTYAKFEDQGGQKFYVFNIHYDHVGKQAREESSKLVMSKIKEINNENLPVIFMGDFNVDKENNAYKVIVNKGFKDSRNESQTPHYGDLGTFNGYNWNKTPENIIDHIFINEGITVNRYGILTDNYGKKYPSDHFPVLIELSFN
ncbi:endonuclease/exonuclease/phosphatase family protein [Belliella sp. DSM 107340]|uniref:Endonuclease/exonuclease/phosphatase family protein n=1 Tax=Belliella calami TaxID=2923436 RepID=A0ABS9UJU9_9BACT|nr:endonuclease/exonuclease/phosphatase family protein [Belliella calami]MCH7396808.1 endonuclease/exonuclease/phosphatase family protein [Belliella calami]